MALSLTIAGVSRTSKFMLPGTTGDVSATLIAGGRGSMRLNVRDILGASGYRPAIDDSLVLADGATTIFSGRIDAVEEVALTSLDTGVVTKITASDWAAVADQVTFTNSYPIGTTLKAVLTDIAAALSAFGVTLDAAQATGPSASTVLNYDRATCTDALNNLQALTGFVWRIDGNKKLRAIAAGTVACGYSLADGTSNTGVIGTVSWKRARATNYLNKATVQAGPTQPIEKTETVTGTGSATTFPLTYSPMPNAATDFILCRGYVSEPGVNWPIGRFGVDTGLQWYYDFSTNSLVRATALGLGVVATFQYQVQFPIVVSVSNSTEVAAHGVYEQLFQAPDIQDIAEATALATALVRRAITTPQTVKVQTNKGIAFPGQTVPLSFAERVISGTFMIVQVDISSDVDGTLLYMLTCVSGSELADSWLDYYRSQGSSGASSSGAAGQISGDILPSLTGQFENGLTAWTGANGLPVSGIDRFESALDSWANGSLLGPALKLGRDVDAFQWAIVAHTFGGSPPGAAASLKIVPTKDSNVKRFALQISQDELSPAAGVYFLTPNTVGSLFLGAPSSSGFGPGFRITKAYLSDCDSSAGYSERGYAAPMGEWTTYTTLWTAPAGATPAINNGTLIARYMRIGKTVFYDIHFVWGSTTTGSGGEWSFSLPFTASDTNGMVGAVYALESGVQHRTGSCKLVSTTTVRPYRDSAPSGYTSGEPFSWAPNDSFRMSGFYAIP